MPPVMMRCAAISVLLLASVLVCCGPSDDETRGQRLNSIIARTEREHTTVRHVRTKQVELWMEDSSVSLLLLDVRSEEEFTVSHLQGAVNVNPAATVESLKDTALRDVSKGEKIVTYCSVGVRSARLAERLQAAGFTGVHNLSGSIFRWANEGKPLYRGQSPAYTVHPYNQTWGQLLKPELRAGGTTEPDSITSTITTRP
jgi:rhodanese-related sulfurtransferase